MTKSTEHTTQIKEQKHKIHTAKSWWSGESLLLSISYTNWLPNAPLLFINQKGACQLKTKGYTQVLMAENKSWDSNNKILQIHQNMFFSLQHKQRKMSHQPPMKLCSVLSMALSRRYAPNESQLFMQLSVAAWRSRDASTVNPTCVLPHQKKHSKESSTSQVLTQSTSVSENTFLHPSNAWQPKKHRRRHFSIWKANAFVLEQVVRKTSPRSYSESLEWDCISHRPQSECKARNCKWHFSDNEGTQDSVYIAQHKILLKNLRKTRSPGSPLGLNGLPQSEDTYW